MKLLAIRADRTFVRNLPLRLPSLQRRLAFGLAAATFAALASGLIWREPLRDASLLRADLRGASLRGANLTGANMEGVDLREGALASASDSGCAGLSRLLARVSANVAAGRIR